LWCTLRIRHNSAQLIFNIYHWAKYFITDTFAALKWAYCRGLGTLTAQTLM
jgi:hypothetical protein